MNYNVTLPVVCFIILLSVSHVLAQEIDTVEKPIEDALAIAKQPQQPAGKFAVDTTWLPASKIQGTGGDITMGEVKAEFTKHFSLNQRFDLSAGLHYSNRIIDAPETAHLPGSLQTLGVDLGAEYRASDKLTMGFRLSPGVSSDFKSLTKDNVRVPAALHATYRVSNTFFLLGGVAYTGQQHFIPVLPLLGALYVPSENWAFSLGIPYTLVTYTVAGKTKIFVGSEFPLGEYRLHDPSIGADVISYRDYRAVAGVDFPVFRAFTCGISGGYAFDRKFVFYEGSRSDVNLGSAPFGRVEVKFAW